jgi:hypothetical protein
MEEEEREATKEEEKQGLKRELSRKIKKDKKMPGQLKYKGEEWEIENWAQCEGCKLWRKLGKGVKVGKKFACGSVGKLCNRKDRCDNDYVTL